MENIYIGDIHGRDCWKKIIQNNPDFDNIIFIGDYLDSFDILPNKQLNNLEEIIDFKKNPWKYLSIKRTNPNIPNIFLLIGNHDIHYWSGILSRGNTSGYQPTMLHSFNQLFEENKNLFQMCCLIGDKLCTHAGVSPEFLRINGFNPINNNIVDYLNDLFRYTPNVFEFGAIYESDNNNPFFINPYGDDKFQSPIWIRSRSLQRANKKDKSIKEKYVQIVGHTPQNQIILKTSIYGGRYIYIDTLDKGQYLIEKNNELSVGKF